MTSETLSQGAGTCGLPPELNLQIEYIPIEEITPDPRNARHHPKRQVDQIMGSMGAYGLTNPPLVDENGVIIAGHGRWMAAKRFGLKVQGVSRHCRVKCT